MTLIDFLQRLLGREKPSGTLARERLQLVLAHDRSDLNPELLEKMRREILEVVQKYVEIDLESGDVSLETGDRVTALVANLPIRRARQTILESSENGKPGPSPADQAAATPRAEGKVSTGDVSKTSSTASEQASVEAKPFG